MGTKTSSGGIGRRLGIVAAALLVLGASVAPVGAQQPQSEDEERRPLRVYGLVGWAGRDLDGLNARLGAQTQPFSAIEEDLLAAGIGVQLVLDRWLLGLEALGMGTPDHGATQGGREAHLYGGYFTLTAGWSLVQTSRVRLYPMVQAGFANTTLDVRPATPSWDDVVSGGSPERSLLTAGNVFASAGAGFDVRLGERLFVGLRGAWDFTPASDLWLSADGLDIDGGPEVDLSGPRAALVIGLERR